MNAEQIKVNGLYQAHGVHRFGHKIISCDPVKVGKKIKWINRYEPIDRNLKFVLKVEGILTGRYQFFNDPIPRNKGGKQDVRLLPEQDRQPYVVFQYVNYPRGLGSYGVPLEAFASWVTKEIQAIPPEVELLKAEYYAWKENEAFDIQQEEDAYRLNEAIDAHRLAVEEAETIEELEPEQEVEEEVSEAA